MLAVFLSAKSLAQGGIRRTEGENPLKELQAKFSAQQGKTNDGVLPQPVGQTAAFQQLSADSKRSSITAKLQSGGQLTDEELEYLRKTDPDLYQKALQVKSEREQYRKDLERCKTREAVETLFARKQQIFLSEIKSVKQCVGISKEKTQELLEQISARMAGIWKEHATFKESADYKGLPRERDLEEAEARRGKHDPADFRRQKASINIRV